MTTPKPESSRRSRSTQAAHVPTSGDTEWAIIGTIAGTFGTAGALKVSPHTDFPERFSETATIYLGDERKPFTVAEAHAHKNQVILQLSGLTDMTAAEKLRGQDIFIPATDLLPLPPDRFYHHDIIGLQVQHVNGMVLGTVTDVLTNSGNDHFVVSTLRENQTVLLPAVKAFIKEIDLAGKRIIVDPIPGIFDEDFDEVP